MKCPRCGLIVTDIVPRCPGCGFSIADLDRRFRRVPARLGFVNDFASLLSAEERAGLEDRLERLQRTLGGELVLVTVKATKPLKPSEYVFWLFNRWRVGGEAHAGVMVLLAQEERRIESEVGYRWEPIISDVESGKVLAEHVLPLLKAGKTYEALKEGLDQLARIIELGVPPEQATPEEFSSERGDP